MRDLEKTFRDTGIRTMCRCVFEGWWYWSLVIDCRKAPDEGDAIWEKAKKVKEEGMKTHR